MTAHEHRPRVVISRLATTALVIAAAVAGCSDGGADDRATPPPSASSPASPVIPPEQTDTEDDASPPVSVTDVAALANPCELVTQEDASALTGLPMDEGALSEPVDSRSCRYNAPASGPVGQVEVYVGQGAEQILSTDQRLGHELIAVPGIGDEALEKDMHLFFRVGETWHLIRVVRMIDPSGLVEPLRAAATAAVGRL